MLGSLRARLIVSFALVVALAVFLAGAGALFLLRDNQQEDARARYGRLTEPLTLGIAALAADNTRSIVDIEGFIDDRSREYGARILLLDGDQVVVHDTEGGQLEGKYVLSFESTEVRSDESRGLRYKWASFDSGDDDVTLFASEVSPGDSRFAAPEYQALIAIPKDKLASAWLELVPRLALAGAIALSVSFVVSYFISRSISGPLARITQASKQMAQGNYDVFIPIKGQDEVGRLSEAFNQMAKEVSTSQRTMKDLLANVSPELKTPLTSIQGFSQAILDGVVTEDDDVKEYSRLVYEEAQRMRGLVDDLLLLSQIESGQVSMDHRRISLEQLLVHTMERFQWAIRDAGIQSGVSLERLPDVVGDARRLEQVFSNLLQNAVRHTPPGGIITINGKVLVGGHVSISVHNTGSYIPKEDLARVFERFFQVDRARARKGGSSGLGLSIVKEIVEAHGGTVRAVSSEERGTEFIVVLPNPRSAEARARRPSPETPRRSAPAVRDDGPLPDRPVPSP
ncbi:MAG: HAMP domain-containing histidine kinase [Chloroflexi bacterium]|nr:HAMP domain-containing histidine kinase [Chloroflexota bacterium]